jgi:inorganic pyrophosphatase
MDDKIISVAKNDMSVSHYEEITDLPEHVLNQVHRFFEDYKKMEKKEVKVLQFEGREKAYEIINDSIDLYNKTFNGSKTIIE